MKKFKIKVIYSFEEPAVIYEAKGETKIKAYSYVINKYRLVDILKISSQEIF